MRIIEEKHREDDEHAHEHADAPGLEHADIVLHAHPGGSRGLPADILSGGKSGTKVLFSRNSFSPVLKENPIYTQGFFDEIRNFAERTQGRKAGALSDLDSLRDTYSLITSLSQDQGLR